MRVQSAPWTVPTIAGELSNIQQKAREVVMNTIDAFFFLTREEGKISAQPFTHLPNTFENSSNGYYRSEEKRGSLLTKEERKS